MSSPCEDCIDEFVPELCFDECIVRDTKILDLIQDCAEVTKSKGFKVDLHATQIALMATEVAEALEHVEMWSSGEERVDSVTRQFIAELVTASEKFEHYRKSPLAIEHVDESKIKSIYHLEEELADLCIRVFSYVGGNDRSMQFLASLRAKIEKNKGRAALHGKRF